MKHKFIHYRRLGCLFSGLLLTVGAWHSAAQQTISTVAGDGSAAIGAAGIGGSNSVAVDTAGNIYVATGGLNTIRKITPANVVTTFAGTGVAGFSGDNNTAASATFKNIQDLYISRNNLYIADAGNRRIRKIDLATNTVTTVAGDGTAGITGNGIGAANAIAVDTAGNIYAATGARNMIRKITPAGVTTTFAGTGVAGFSGDNNAAAAATLNLPADLYVSSNKLYVADCKNRRIRSIDLATQTITTVAGDGTTAITGTGIGAATGVAVDDAGNIFVTTGAAGNAIRKITAGTHSTIAGGNATGAFGGDNGLAIGAALNLPSDLYIKGTDLYVADEKNRRVRKITNTAVGLALELLQFTATAQPAKTLLQWTVTSDQALTGFDVERSTDSRSFNRLATVAAVNADPAAYQHADLSPLTGRSFYRLKMRYAGGNDVYSPVRQVIRSTGGSVSLSPNPATAQLNLLVADEALLGTTAYVTDLQGRQVTHFTVTAVAGIEVRSWASGIYFLKLADGSTYRFVKK
ncbi:T9SS type A sorting domain-containing protein [Taibaiella chishuiensis]|uniref:Putative secreted protein (Por secretion system target) n=1 Tax=Taibaiella chishuiensis TaxID=1434707 RepID=A0A2P8CX21_9BACT|nr:T9SS type A sorting domain-containing protein [Taibaiella chishuiensis]PSK89477.1 putative secreted protein (Por secretion system target) [Taibaiella chishuiensis]